MIINTNIQQDFAAIIDNHNIDHSSHTDIREQLSNLSEDISSLSNYVTPQMYGAKADGETDDTAAIQAALDVSSFVYIPAGTYMVNANREGYNDPEVGGIKPHNGHTIVMDSGATLKALPNSTGHYSVINLYGVENVKISGGKIEGEKDEHNGTTGEWGHGIMVRGCSDITIEGIEIFNCWGDSICTGYMYDSGANCKNVKIYNCKLHDSRRQGVSVVSGHGVIIRDCEIYNISGTLPQSGIDIEPDGTVGVVENVIIDGCYIHDTANASIIIAQVTNKIQTLRITNCQVDKVMGLSGNDVVLNNNTIGTVQVSSDFINVANSVINQVLMAGGNGRFYNCQIVTEEDDALIFSDLSDYPNKTVDLVEFYGCLLRTPHQYLMEFGSMNTLTNGMYPEKMIRFNSCKIDLLGGTYPCFVERHPAELVFDNCDVSFVSTPYALFNVKNMWDTKVIIRNSKFAWDGTADFIIDSGTHSNYTFELFNNEFSTSRKFVRCASAGTAGGTIRLFNNKMSNIDFYNNHNYTILGSNTEDETIAKTLAALPVYEGGVS